MCLRKLSWEILQLGHFNTLDDCSEAELCSLSVAPEEILTNTERGKVTEKFIALVDQREQKDM